MVKIIKVYVDRNMRLGYISAMQDTATIQTFPQGSLLFPRATFQFKAASGRIVSASPAQSFWVCNSQQAQRANGVVGIARSGKSSGYAHHFTLADVAQYFAL